MISYLGILNKAEIKFKTTSILIANDDRNHPTS